MNNFRIVDLKPEDTQLIQQTGQLALETSQSISKIWLPTLEDALEEVHDSLEEEDGISWVLMDNDTVVAWIGAFPMFGKIVEIHPLLVHMTYQNQGLGRRLVTDVTTWARQQSVLTLFLSTSDETNATSFFFLGSTYTKIQLRRSPTFIRSSPIPVAFG